MYMCVYCISAAYLIVMVLNWSWACFRRPISLVRYAERLGAGRFFAGLMIGALPILGVLGSLFTERWLTFMAFKHIWIICSLFTVLGSVLYALAGLMRFKWTLLIARGLMGFFGAFSLPGIYVSHTVGLKRRTLEVSELA